MLTIKHVEDQGSESLIQCERVSYTTRDPEGHPALFAFGCVPANDGGATHDGCTIYGSGRVYVMNDTGATVGTYRLES